MLEKLCVKDFVFSENRQHLFTITLCSKRSVDIKSEILYF